MLNFQRALKNTVDPGYSDIWYNATPSGDELTTEQAARIVPFFYRAISLIASAVAQFPHAVRRGEEPAPEFEPSFLAAHGWTAASQLLIYGASYWREKRNRYGMPGWENVPNANVRIKRDYRGEFQGFDVRENNQQVFYKPEALLFFWWPNSTGEMSPGTPPAVSALADANLLWYLTKFAQGYMLRGGPHTFLSVDGNPAQPELDRLDRWLNRLISGVKSMWRSIVIRSVIKPITFGGTVKDASSGELASYAQNNVAVAFGVPLSMLLSNAANYATALQDARNFTDGASMPVAKIITDVLNKRLYMPAGVELVLLPGKLEAFQDGQLQQASTVTQLQAAGIITKDEAREWLGLEPIAEPTPTAPAAEMAIARPVQIAPEAMLKAWRARAILAIKSGQPIPRLPLPNGDAIYNDLLTAKSAGDVRGVFERHWPKAKLDPALELAREIRLAREVLQNDQTK